MGRLCPVSAKQG